jgi:hypothetical protein
MVFTGMIQTMNWPVSPKPAVVLNVMTAHQNRKNEENN